MVNHLNVTFSRFVANYPFKANGLSMLPILQPDDLLYFEIIGFKNVRIDDFILARKGHDYIVHRVIYKNRSSVVTKGDSNFESDGKILPSQILGRVIKVKRGRNVFKPDSIYLIQSSYYLKEIVAVKRLLDKNKIRHVFLKGLPLHLYYQKTHPKRLYADCDILIDRGDLEKAHKVFFSSDYRVRDFSLSKPHAKTGWGRRIETSYQKKEGDFLINFDVHYEVVFLMTQLGNLNSLYPQKSVERLTREFIDRGRDVHVDGEFFNILDKRYLVIYLALHFFHHNFKGAYRLEFLSKIIRTGRFNNGDWGFIIRKINQYGLGNFVVPAFKLVNKYYGLTVPNNIITHIDFKRHKVSKVLFTANIFDEEPRISSGINRFKNIFDLSPRPLWMKSLVFAEPQVIFYVFFVLRQKLFYFLKGLSKSLRRLS